MSRLNKPRAVPYVFRVVSVDGWVWLYDDSERTYICDAVPKVYAEPLYALAEENDDDYPEAAYYAASAIAALPTVPVPVRWPEDVAPTTPHKDAWDAAREEAQGNCLI